jgi:hypothetical protein
MVNLATSKRTDESMLHLYGSDKKMILRKANGQHEVLQNQKSNDGEEKCTLPTFSTGELR